MCAHARVCVLCRYMYGGLVFRDIHLQRQSFLVNCSKKRADQMDDEQNWGVPSTEETERGATTN